MFLGGGTAPLWWKSLEKNACLVLSGRFLDPDCFDLVCSPCLGRSWFDFIQDLALSGADLFLFAACSYFLCGRLNCLFLISFPQKRKPD